jgi:hypothetical protein
MLAKKLKGTVKKEMSEEEQLNYIYKEINKATDLSFGIDKECENLPSKRSRQKPTLLSGTGKAITTFPF